MLKCLGSLCGSLCETPGDGDAPLRELRGQLAALARDSDSQQALEEAIHVLGGGLSPTERQVSNGDCEASVRRKEASRRLQYQRTWNNVVTAMKSLEKIRGKFGMDIGGTLVKCALFTPSSPSVASVELPEHFGSTAHRHPELAFDSTIDGQNFRVDFVTSETIHLDALLTSAKSIESSEADRSIGRLQVVAAGGGAHRFKEVMRRSMNVEMVPFQEMESLVSGLRFLCSHGPDDEVFTIDDSDAVVPMMWPWPLFPCLLVVMGSGVSVLRIERDRGHTRKARGGFTRIGGTACGGATFLGLSQLVTSAKSFDEALNLAKQGDATRVNKLVSDIYGKEGSAVLGLPGDLTAAYFGKLISADGVKPPPVDEADLAAAVLAMVVQSTVGLAVALSKQPHVVNGAARSSRDAGTNSESLVGALNSIGSMRRTVSSDSPGSLGCRDHRVPVFFAGGFLARNTMAQQIIGRTFRKLTGSQALFLKHSDFLGALGAVGSTM